MYAALMKQPCTCGVFHREIFIVVSASASKFNYLSKIQHYLPTTKMSYHYNPFLVEYPSSETRRKKVQGRTFKVLPPTLEELNQIYFFVEIFIILK